MTNFEYIKTEAEDFYNSTWRDWYQGRDCRIATLECAVNDEADARYSPSKDLIYLPLCSGDIEDYDKLPADDSFCEYEKWRVWKQALVHEMLHEYQYKAVCGSSEEGGRLYNQYKNAFLGNGHDELFFTALAEKAAYFKMTSEELIAKL